MGGIEDNQPNSNRSEGIEGISSMPQKTPNEIRNESFLTWLKYMLCPNFKYSSFIFIISCLDLIVYIITLLFGIKITEFELLAPKFETLDLFGMKYPSKIYRGQLHRLILYGLLHANFVHLVTNLLSQIIIGSLIEGFIGTKKTGILYLLSNIFGGLFSCVMNFNPGVGASVAIFGFLGAYFGFTIVNWNFVKNNMSYIGTSIFMIFIVIMNVSFGLKSNIIDNYGHLGGFIYGFLFLFILVTPFDPNRGSFWLSYEKWRKYSMITASVSIMYFICYFWIIQKP